MNYIACLIIGVIMLVLFIVLGKVYKKPDKTFLQSKTEKFKEVIQKHKCKNKDEQELVNQLLSAKIETEVDYKRLVFLYNQGNFRTDKEIEDYLYDEKYKYFDDHRHYVNAAAGVIPFSVVFLFVFFAVDCPIFNVMLALAAGGIAGMIGGMIGYSSNISEANRLELDENSPAVSSEITKRRMTIAATIVGSTSAVRHTKKAVKDLLNVESWKEMK